MARFVAALLLLALFGVSHCSDSIKNFRRMVFAHSPLSEAKVTRQTTCGYPSDTPQECVTASNELDDVLDSSAVINLDTFNSLLEDVCTPDCLSATVEYLDCLGQPDVDVAYTDVYCAQNEEGQYCAAELVDIVDDPAFLTALTCGIGGTCESLIPGEDCQSAMQTVVNNMGCCASSFFNSTLSLIPPSQFATCDVDLGQACASAVDDGVAVDGGVVNSVGFGLLAIFVVAAALVNPVLF